MKIRAGASQSVLRYPQLRMLPRLSNPPTRLLACFALAAVYGTAQHQRGELRLEVHDAAAGALVAAVDLTSEINQLHRKASTDVNGRYAAQDLPFEIGRAHV